MSTSPKPLYRNDIMGGDIWEEEEDWGAKGREEEDGGARGCMADGCMADGGMAEG